MDIETNAYKEFASQIHRTRMILFFPEPTLARRHGEILNSIEALRQYFLRFARQAEELEGSLPITTTKTDLMLASSSFSFDPHLSSLLRKGAKPMEASASASYSYMEIDNVYKNSVLSHTNKIEIGNAKAEGECELGLWKEKAFDPRFVLHAQAGLSLLDLSSSTKIGKGKVYGKVDTRLGVGSAHLSGDVVVSAKEQTLDLSVGVAALEGEASCVLSVFGASITLSGSASLMSAGLDLSYSHKNREWEIGSKLGFIAGLGWKIKVNY